MALEIVKLYISLISQGFMLSDVVVMTNVTNSRPPLLSTKSHSLSTAYHLQRILGEVQECVNDIKSLDISSEINQSLKSLLESIRWRFEDTLTSHWLRGKTENFFLAYILLNQCNFRRKFILSSWIMDFKPGRTICYMLLGTLWTLPEAYDVRGI